MAEWLEEVNNLEKICNDTKKCNECKLGYCVNEEKRTKAKDWKDKYELEIKIVDGGLLIKLKGV